MQMSVVARLKTKANSKLLGGNIKKKIFYKSRVWKDVIRHKIHKPIYPLINLFTHLTNIIETLLDFQVGKKEYIKAVYCHPAYLTYMQSTS